MDRRYANRQVCDLAINEYKTNEPFLFFDTANTSGFTSSADSVYAMAKGTRRIDFPNSPEQTLTVEAQVVPFKLFAMLSDGTIETTGVYSTHETIKCTTAGEIDITPKDGMTIQTGTVFVYPAGSYGDSTAKIAGTFASNKFTATDATKIAVDSEYEVGYIVSRTGVQKVSFNTKKMPKTYSITMSTLFKDEDGNYVPMLIIAHKCAIQRNFELSFSSEGDPISISLTWDILETKDGKQTEMIELTDDIS